MLAFPFYQESKLYLHFRTSVLKPVKDDVIITSRRGVALFLPPPPIVSKWRDPGPLLSPMPL